MQYDIPSHVDGLTDEAIADLLTRPALPTKYRRAVWSEASRRGLHVLPQADVDGPEMCTCGAVFTQGFNLQSVKRAHLEAMAVAR